MNFILNDICKQYIRLILLVFLRYGFSDAETKEYITVLSLYIRFYYLLLGKIVCQLLFHERGERIL